MSGLHLELISLTKYKAVDISVCDLGQNMYNHHN
jgi:hypothetical protein